MEAPPVCPKGHDIMLPGTENGHIHGDFADVDPQVELAPQVDELAPKVDDVAPKVDDVAAKVDDVAPPVHVVPPVHAEVAAALGVRQSFMIEGVPGLFVLGRRGTYVNKVAMYKVCPMLYPSADNIYDPIGNNISDEENEALPILVKPRTQFWCPICEPPNGNFLVFANLRQLDEHRVGLHRGENNDCLVPNCPDYGFAWDTPTSLAQHQKIHHYRFIRA